MTIEIHIHDDGVHDSTEILPVLQQILKTQETLVGNSQDAQAAMSRLEGELGEIKTSALGAVDRIVAQRDAARSLADELQAKVDAGDTALGDIALRASAVADGLDAAESDLDKIGAAAAPAAPSDAPSPDTGSGSTAPGA